MTDPMKEMVRLYDARVVNGGGHSLFELKPGRPVMMVERMVFPPEDGEGRRPRYRWRGENLKALRQAYQAGMSYKVMADKFGTSIGRIYMISREEGWGRRKAARKAFPLRADG